MKKNIIFVYAISFVLFFLILLFSDFLFKAKFNNVKTKKNIYFVSALQSYNLKKNGLITLLNDTLNVNSNGIEKKKNFKFTDYSEIKVDEFYSISTHTENFIKFKLITRDYLQSCVSGIG